MEQLLDAEDVAEILNVARSTAYELLRSGKIRVVKMGTKGRIVRVKADALQEYIDAMEVKASVDWQKRVRVV